MGQTVVFPLTKDLVILGKGRAGQALVEDEIVTIAKAKSKSELPVIFAGIELRDGHTPIETYRELSELGPEDIERWASAGFKYRRTSHHASIEWWGNEETELLAKVCQVLVLQSFLEGRKRVEALNHWQEIFDKPLEIAGFQFEGVHRDYKELDPKWHRGRVGFADVSVWGYVFAQDGLFGAEGGPAFLLKPTDLVFLVENETVKRYHRKNMELFQKDEDLYREVGQGTKFADYLEMAYKFTKGLPNVRVLSKFDGVVASEEE